MFFRNQLTINYSYVVACVANTITFAIGTSIAWTSPELEKLHNDTTIPMSEEDDSWVSALFQLGAAFGPLIYGFLADAIGRKYTLLSLGVPIVVCHLLMAFVRSLPVFFAARFIIGFMTGGVFTVMPMYLAEIAHTSNRGILSSLLIVFQNCGILFTYVLGPYVSILVFNLILAIVPAIFTVVFFLLSPETPQYLVKNKKSELARQTLKSLRGSSADVDEELSAIERAIEEESGGSFIDIFRTKGTLKAFCMTIGLVISQQLTGIIAVVAYAQTIFEKAGASLKPAICSIILGIVQLLASFITPSLVDRFGRKILLLVSLSGLVVVEALLGVYFYLQNHGTNLDAVSFLPIICLILFIIFYAVGIGPLPWTLTSELFPNNVKSKASSLTAVTAWGFSFLVVKYFQSVSDRIGMGVSFLIFSGCCAASILFVQFFVIETGRKTFEQIQKELNE